VDGGISFIEAYELLDSQSDTLTRDTTQSPGISCGESSSESVAAPASLNSQVCSLPVLPVEPHMRSKDRLICATGNTVHRSSAKTRTEKNERNVATTPLYQYDNTRLSINSLKCFERLPWQLWRSRNTRRHSTPLSASVTRTTVNPHYSRRFVVPHPSLPHIMGEGEGRGAFLVRRISLFARDSRDL
jgi:hypothetical protein